MTGSNAVASSGAARGTMADTPALLFDTTALIDAYRGKAWLRPRFQALIDNALDGYLSVLSEAELWRGLRPSELERHEALLSYFTILPPESTSARLAGAWMNAHEARGLGWMDALITATGQRAGLPVFTRDARLARLLGGEAEFELYVAA